MRVVSGSPEAAGGVALAGPALLEAEADAETIKVYRFTAPPETYLDGSAKYWIVADGNRPGGFDVYWSFTISPDEDPGSGSGWRIDNGNLGRLYGSGAAFSAGSDIDPICWPFWEPPWTRRTTARRRGSPASRASSSRTRRSPPRSPGPSRTATA